LTQEYVKLIDPGKQTILR